MSSQIAGGLAAVIMIVLMIIGIIASILVLRPMVDYGIVGLGSNNPPKELDFRYFTIVQLTFQVRNRGGSDAPISANITVVNAYIGQAQPLNWTKPIVFYTVLTAHSEQYGGWNYYVGPIGDPSTIEIHFHIMKSWRQDTSGMINWIFGEYNPWYTDLVYDRIGPGQYRLAT